MVHASSFLLVDPTRSHVVPSATQSLKEKLDLRALSISQRASILEDGLRDRTGLLPCTACAQRSLQRSTPYPPAPLLPPFPLLTRYHASLCARRMRRHGHCQLV